MVTCSNCGLSLNTPTSSTCPRCGSVLPLTPPQGTNYGQAGGVYDAQTRLSGGSFPPMPGSGWAGEQYGPADRWPSTPQPIPTYGPGAPPPPPTGYGSGVSPFGTGYGQGGVPFAPGYGQSGPPSAPAVPPGWGAPAPFPPTPPRKSRAGLIIGILVAVIVLLGGGLGFALFARGSSGPVGNTTASATTAPSATATASETVFFHDPLTSNANGWSNDNTHCFFANGSYHIKGNYLCFSPAGNIGDASISVDVKQVAGPPTWAYGLALRHPSSGNFYEFAIASNGQWDFSKVVGAKRTRIIDFTASAAIKQGINVVNRLLVRARGSHFEFFINGVQVGQADDTTFSTGVSGVVSSGDPIEVAFNNFTIALPN